MKMNIELKPWLTPNFVLGVLSTPRTREDGFLPSDEPKWSLKEVDAEILSEMCDDFRKEVFRKAGKPDPKQNEPKL